MSAFSRLCLIGLAAAATTSTVGARTSQVPDEPIKWALAVTPATTTTTPGATITLSLTATIDEGWHLYSLTLPAGGPIPTRITVPDGQEFKPAGDIVEPTPKTAFDANFNMSLEFHEEKATFGVPVKSAAGATLGSVPARVAVSFQTCNDKFCLPPKQVVVTTQVNIRPGTSQQPPTPPDRDAFNKALVIKDLDAQIVAIEKYAADFPDSDTVYFAAARGMRNIGDADGANTTRLAAFVHAIEGAMDAAGTKNTARQYQRADVYFNLANRLLARQVLPDDAARLAAKSVPLLNEADFMAKELATHNERQVSAERRTPGRTPDPFPRAESEERWLGIRANHLSALGRAQMLLGHLPEAETTLRASFELAPVMETALALSTLRERAGKLKDALDFAIAAQLTGKMTAPEFAQLHAIYQKTHSGSLDGLEALLDATYDVRHVNPVVAPKYRATAARTDRTVLAEMFTGGACIPCVSVDLSLERTLERYTRNEVALLVYHIHAPTSDPYSNFAVEARSQYYGVHGAPTVLLDGVTAPIGEGGGAMATTIFPKLDAAIGTRLDTSASTTILATATRTGSTVTARLSLANSSAVPQTARLQAVLVETEARYSGENGLRVQPMVVRDMLGSGSDRGVLTSTLGSEPLSWTIDLPKLEATNLAYYDWYIADLKKRANIDASFREKKATINPNRLALVAFVQDDVTHAVLQSIFVPIK